MMIVILITIVVVAIACIYAYFESRAAKKEREVNEAEKPTAEPEKAERPRDPKTGRFIKRT